MTDVKNEAPDRPTDERMSKGGWREEVTSPLAGAKTRIRMLDVTEIDRLFMSGHLTVDQHTTLERFSHDLYEAGMVFCPKAGFIPSSSRGNAQFIADRAAMRIKRINHHIQILSDSLSQTEKSIVLDALTNDRRLRPSEAKLMSIAANALTHLYDPRERSRAAPA